MAHGDIHKLVFSILNIDPPIYQRNSNEYNDNIQKHIDLWKRTMR
jgi:hypothetical protein